MAKRRKSSAAKAAASQSTQPPSPQSSQNLRTQSAPSNFTSSTGNNLYNNIIAAILAGVQIFSEGDRWTRIPIILGILFVLFTVYVFASYIIFPILGLLKYPLTPVTWLIVKSYNIVHWFYSWIAWAVKGMAWLGFYINFFRIFVGYAADAFNALFGALESGYEGHEKQENSVSESKQDEDGDEDEMPELVDP